MEKSKSSRGTKKFRQPLAILIVIGTIAGLAIQSSRFFLGYIDGDALFRQMIYFAASFLVPLFIYKLPEPRPNPDRARTLTKISFIVGGALYGAIITFFVVGFLLTAILGGPIPGGLLGNAYLAFSFIVAPIIWGYIGYLIFKRSKYSSLSVF